MTFGVDKGLYPAPGRARGEALKWLVWANVTLGEAIGRWRRNVDERTPAELRNVRAAAEAKKDVAAAVAIFEGELGGKSYVLGESVSIVDFHLASFFQWLGFCGFDVAPFAKTAAWVARCSARPALKNLQG